MERDSKARSTDTPLFDDEFLLVEPEAESVAEAMVEPGQEPEPESAQELSKAEIQLDQWRERMRKGLEESANRGHPKFKGKISFYGRPQRIRVVFEVLIKETKAGKYAFSLKDLEDLRREVTEWGYVTGPAIDIGYEAARRVVSGPDNPDKGDALSN